MQKSSAFLLILLGCASDYLVLPCLGQFATRNNSVALIGGKIYTSPKEQPILDGVVIVKNGQIASVGERSRIKIPDNVRRIDCTGLTLTSGFWNSHIHLYANMWTNAANQPTEKLAKSLEDMLTRYGFTTVLDVGSELENTKA